MGWLCQTRDNQFISVTDPASYTDEQRVAYLELLKNIHGLVDCH